MAAPPVLVFKHIFGLKSDVQNGIFYIEDNLLLYPAGHNAVLLNTEKHSQRFIHGSDVSAPSSNHSINAITLSPNRRFVAVAEQGEKAVVTVYDSTTLKKRKVLTTNECRSHKYVSLKFSSDSKELLTMGGGPDWTLVRWQWEKIKPLSTICFSADPDNSEQKEKSKDESKDSKDMKEPVNDYIHEVSYSLVDPSVVCVIGNGVLNYYQIESSEFQPLPSELGGRELEDFLCHVWLGNKTFVGTQKGNLLIFNEHVFYNDVLNPTDGRPVLCLAAFADRLVCGTSEGAIYFLKLDPTTDTYNRTHQCNLTDNPYPITSVVVSLNEENLAVASANSQAFTTCLSNLDSQKGEEVHFSPIGHSAHHGAITGMDVCLRKPLIVTCGTDRSVRVWNYLDRKMEICKFFQESEPHAVAFHPSGLHMIVGFSDKLRLMSLLVDDIKCYKELSIKGCHEVQFSNGGQYFAAVVGGNSIGIHSTYTADNILSFRAPNQKVRSIYWNLDDTGIVSAGSDGGVYEWKVKKSKEVSNRTQDFVARGVNMSCALCTVDGRIYCVGSDATLREIVESNPTDCTETGVLLTQIVLSHPPQRMLFAGSENGFIRSYNFPLMGDSQDYVCHTGPVSRMRISHRDDYLFSAGEDGTLAIFEIREKEGRVVRRAKGDMLVPWSEEVLITVGDLEEKHSTMLELKNKVDDLTLHVEYQLRVRDMNYQEKLKDVTERFSQEIEAARNKYEMLRDEKQDMEMEFDEKKKKVVDEHQIRVQKLEVAHQKQMVVESDKYKSLVRKIDEETKKAEEQRCLREEAHQRQLEALQEEYEAKLEDEQANREKLETDREDLLKEYEETKRQLEEDGDLEVETLKDNLDQQLKCEREATLRLKGENGIMNKKYSQLEKDIEDQKEEIKAVHEKKEHLNEHVTKLRAKITDYSDEVTDRNQTIAIKERKIYELKKTNQDLEKYKFVLDHRIKHLKRCMEPRENTMNKLKAEVKEMDTKLQTAHKLNSSLQQQHRELMHMLTSMQRDAKSERQLLHKREARIRQFQCELEEVVKHIQDPKPLLVGSKELYDTYVDHYEHTAEVDPEIQKEYERQRAYLERTVENLKHKVIKDSEAHSSDNMQIMQENVALVKEISELRRESKMMRQLQREKKLSGLQQQAPRVIFNEEEYRKEVEANREKIRQIRKKIEDAQMQHLQPTVQQPEQV